MPEGSPVDRAIHFFAPDEDALPLRIATNIIISHVSVKCIHASMAMHTYTMTKQKSKTSPKPVQNQSIKGTNWSNLRLDFHCRSNPALDI
jgi:hypothetical protein